MRHSAPVFVRTALVLVLAVATFVSVGAMAARKPAPPASVIAVVDVQKALAGLSKRADLLADLRKRVEEFKAKAEQTKNELQAEEDKVKAMADGPAKIAAAKSFREHVLRAKFEQDYSKSLLDESEVEMLHEMYNDIDKASEEYAKLNGYNMVLASDERIEIPKSGLDELSQTIKLKRMLYVDPSLDITDELITYMNNSYGAGKK